MKELTCIVCPNGCSLLVDDNLNVSGNLCPKGKQFALNEITDPKRVVTTTCKTNIEGIPVVSVKSDGEIRINDVKKVIEKINSITINKPMGINDVLIENVLNSGVNIIISSSILMEEKD